VSEPAASAPRNDGARYRHYGRAFSEIARLVDLTDGFALIPVEVEGPDLGRELARSLTAEGHPCVFSEPLEEDDWQELARWLLDAVPEEGGAAIVIGGRELPPAAGGALRQVNLHRDTIVRHLARPLIWCGPRPFLALTWERAPDFWSIRTVDYVVVPDEEEAHEVEELRSLLEQARAQGDKANERSLRLRLAGSQIARDDLEQAEGTLRAGPSGHEDPAILLGLAEIQLRRGDREGARHLLHSVEGGKLTPEERLSRELLEARSYQADGDLLHAKPTYERALDSARAIGDKRAEVQALLGLGSLAKAPEGFRLLSDAVELARKVSPLLEAEAYARTSIAYGQHHDRRAAGERLDFARAAWFAHERAGTEAERAALRRAIEEAAASLHPIEPALDEAAPLSLASPAQYLADKSGAATTSTEHEGALGPKPGGRLKQSRSRRLLTAAAVVGGGGMLAALVVILVSIATPGVTILAERLHIDAEPPLVDAEPRHIDAEPPLVDAEPRKLQCMPLEGRVGSSSEWGSGWMDLTQPSNFEAGNRLRIEVAGSASKILVRLLPYGQDPRSPAGLLTDEFTVPADHIVEVPIETDRSKIIQISVHGSAKAFNRNLGVGNGPANLSRIERCK
jgi:tetratricopeptide (TPR) repeat protein